MKAAEYEEYNVHLIKLFPPPLQRTALKTPFGKNWSYSIIDAGYIL